MPALVILETHAPSKLADDLMLAGYKVFEALAVSEVLFLFETEQIDVVVIGPDVEDPVPQVQTRITTLRLKPEATSKDVIWELSQLFPAKTPVQ